MFLEHTVRVKSPYTIIKCISLNCKCSNLSASPDGSYNKTYYIPINFRTTWMGSYQWCKSNDLKILSFECQDEHDKFLAKMNTQQNRDTLKDILFLPSWANLEFYFGAYAIIGGDPNGFIWYETGARVTGPVKLTWNDGEPNNAGNIEFCASMAHWRGKIAVNDLMCIDSSTIKNVVCQKTKFNQKKKGFKD